MGTVGYMSPEQALGKAVDFRSDQFALGAMLYEMATGRRAFQRGSAPETLTAVIRDEPEPIAAINPKVPAPVRWTIERCLAKEPRSRYTSTEDLARELATVRDHLSEATSAVTVPSPVPAEPRRRGWLLALGIVGTILLVAGAGLWQLWRTDYFWKNPLAGATYTRFTDWEGSELDAAISRDGKFVAFVSDRDGPFDIWLGQVGGGGFLNLTKGGSYNRGARAVQGVAFTDDGSHVSMSILSVGPPQGSDIWLVPTLGGAARKFLPGAVEAAWSPARSHVAYHPLDDGDPIFVADRNGGDPRQVFVSEPGIHNHYPTWSPDGRFIYFSRGVFPGQVDVWRVPPAGGSAERLTSHNSAVTHPTLLDRRTLIYCATRGHGSGSGLFAMDVERRIPHELSSGLEEYISVAASADGRRIASTVANPSVNVWAVPITDHVVEESGVSRSELSSVRAAAPRFGADYLLYLSSKGATGGLWKHANGVEMELWNGSDGSVTDAPAVSSDGNRICFVVRAKDRARLYVMAADGTGPHPIAPGLEVQGTPSWSPDGKWIAIAVSEGKATPLYKVPVEGGEPVRVVGGDAVLSNPVWSPDGRFILYSEGKGGAVVRLRGVTPDGEAVPLPEVEVTYQGDRYRFLPDGKALVVMLGNFQEFDFWLLDLSTGRLAPIDGPEAGLRNEELRRIARRQARSSSTARGRTPTSCSSIFRPR